MNYPFPLETRHTPGVTQISGENKGVNSHVVQVNVGPGSTGRSVLLCAPGSAAAWPSLTSALLQPCSHWDCGAHFWDWQWDSWLEEGGWARWDFWELWGPWKQPELQKGWKLWGLGACSIVEGTGKGIITEIVKEIPHEKRLPLLSMLDKKSSLFKSWNRPRDKFLTQGFKRTLQVGQLKIKWTNLNTEKIYRKTWKLDLLSKSLLKHGCKQEKAIPCDDRTTGQH